MAKQDSQFSDPHFDYEHNILKNLPGFTDQELLDKFERIQATKAILNLPLNPVMGQFDTAHLKAIHARIFQNIYPWAGEFRRVNMHRSGSYPFAAVQFLETNLKATFAKLAAENHLRGLDAPAFSNRAAYYQGELNAIHPFRDANGRAQREFVRELAAEAGYRINWSRVTREQMYAASIESHHRGKNAALAALIAKAIEPTRHP
jgi:cell filamentation protein